MDADREGRQPVVVTEDNVMKVKKLVLQDRRIPVKLLASETGIRERSIELIYDDHLNMNKVSAR